MGAGLVVGHKALATQHDHPAQHEAHSHLTQAASSSQSPTKDRESKLSSLPAPGHPLLIEAPDLPKLPWKMVDGAKEFHLIAEPVRVEFVPGRAIDVWGYNGSMPGPTLEANEGDRIRVIFENHLDKHTQQSTASMKT
jgi:FtsP/CotA-like multicopper oxidase with cupredoxin domain